MATWLIIVIVICVINLLMAIWAFFEADRIGHDPASAFILVMFFSVIGLLLILLMSNRYNDYKDLIHPEKKEVEPEDNPEQINNDQKSVVIFYSKRTKDYHMIANNNPIGEEQYDNVFQTEGVRFYFQGEDESYKEMTKRQAKNLMKY